MFRPKEHYKPLEVKCFNLELGFKVKDNEVLSRFLDPKENKQISEMLQTKGQFASKLRTKSSKAPAIDYRYTEPAGPDTLELRPTQNFPGALYNYSGTQASPITPFKAQMPIRKTTDNPKIALGLFRKRVIASKSEKTINKLTLPDRTQDSILIGEPAQLHIITPNPPQEVKQKQITPTKRL
jgi:hypothetical protein